LEDHDPAPYYYRGNVVMIGDAAHAITPFAGNGASQAFEDASTLLAIFKEVKDVSEIPKAFEAFDAIRRPRSQKVVELSRMFGRLCAFMEEGVGDDLDKIRKRMKKSAAIMSDADLQAQNEEAVKRFRGLL
jgi:salicylate hydroxylase